MNIDNDWTNYLNDTKFSDGKKFNFKNKQSYSISRIDLLQKMSIGLNVLHLGACDHIPLIEKKIKDNTWLHKRLMDSAKTVIGVDINKDAVDYCNGLGYSNIKCMDLVLNSMDVIQLINNYSPSKKIDLLVAGEIIEHLPNPVDFLKLVNNAYAGIIDKIVITVPNVFYYLHLLGAIKGYEIINTDHKYWFTPYTISKVVTCSGMLIDDIQFVDTNQIISRILNHQLISASTIVITAKLSKITT